MKHLFITVGLVFVFLSPAQASVQGQEVSYRSGDTALKGYLAWDDAVGGKRPGVLVVHEWWGHNAYARKRARMLAELGYTALAVDMYGDGKQASHPKDAARFSGQLRQNMSVGKARFLAAMDLLKKHKSVDASRIAAIGYCFGGGMVLEMARSGLSLRGVVSFHGGLATPNPAKPGVVQARVLVLNGADDPFIKPEQIRAFEEEMKQAGVDYRLIHYPGAKHSFTNPNATAVGKKFNLPLAYHAEADQKSWAEMQVFFKKIFQ